MPVIALRETNPSFTIQRPSHGAGYVTLDELNGLLHLDLPECAALNRLDFATRQLRAGESLVHCGDECRAVYAVRFGSLRSAMIDADGAEQGLGFPMCGDVVGTDGLATGRHTAHAAALERSEVVVIPLARIAEIARTLPGFDLLLYRIIGRETMRDHATLYLLGSLNAEGRVAAFLLNLSERYGELGYARNVFNLRMTRNDIASYLGLTLETVSRAFSAYAACDLLRVEGREIEILDRDSLQRAITAPSAVLRGGRTARPQSANYAGALALAS